MGSKQVGKSVSKWTDPLNLFGNTETGSSQQAPSYSDIIAPLAGQAAGFLGSEGTKESPFYSDLARMFSEVMKKSSGKFELPSYITDTLQNAVTTGLPSGGTPLEETEYYKGTYPAMKRSIYEDIIPGVAERYGAGGGLRTSDYTKAAVGAGGKAMSDYTLNAAAQAYGMEEAAKQRQLTALPTAISAAESEANLPVDLLIKLITGAGGIESQQYPNLASMLSLIGMGSGQTGTSTQQQPNFSCCFIMLEAGDLTERVREVRDQLFSPNSNVARGYKRMAKWLVPKMRGNTMVKRAIKFLMTSPLAKFAKLYKEGDSRAILFLPICYFWVAVWRFYAISD